LFSHEYGWKTEDVLRLTMKEVSWRLDAITQRKKSDLQLQAKLHGLEYKNSAPAQEKVEIDDNAKNVFDKLLKEKKHGK
jgi:hypothetical protein